MNIQSSLISILIVLLSNCATYIPNVNHLLNDGEVSDAITFNYHTLVDTNNNGKTFGFTANYSLDASLLKNEYSSLDIYYNLSTIPSLGAGLSLFKKRLYVLNFFSNFGYGIWTEKLYFLPGAQLNTLILNNFIAGVSFSKQLIIISEGDMGPAFSMSTGFQGYYNKLYFTLGVQQEDLYFKINISPKFNKSDYFAVKVSVGHIDNPILKINNN